MSQYGARRDDYGTGAYRRRIVVRCEGERAVRSDLEDDFHRFGVRVEHDGSAVTRVEGRAERWPWTTCPAAIAALARLHGAALTRSHAELARRAVPTSQCTHLLDLAILAITCAAREDAGVEYRIDVPDRDAERTRATLARDDAPLLDWSVEGITLVAPTPAPFQGRSMMQGFGSWAEAELAPDLAEAAQLLRRALMIAMGRQFDFERVERATEFGAAAGNCHSFQRDVVEQARRQHGMVLDFTKSPERLLHDLEDTTPT